MKGVTPPKIGIIVPVYKSELYLSECINSLLNQTMNNIEIILINDGSPDNSGAICDVYAKKDSRVKVIHQANTGAAEACNNGVSVSKAEFLMFLDADDWLEPETCEVAYNTAKTKDADVVFWSYINEYQDKTIIAKSIFDRDQIFEGESLIWLRRRMIGLLGSELANPTNTDSINMGWAKIYKRELITSNKIWGIDTSKVGSTDVAFNIHVFKYVNRVAYIHRFYNHYRRYNPNALTATYKFTLFAKLLNLFSYINAFIVENSLGNEFKQALNNRIALSTINNVLSITSKSNSSTYKEKIDHLKIILNNSLYISAFKELQFNYLPLHWKLFFFAAKTRSANFVYFLGILMHKFRN